MYGTLDAAEQWANHYAATLTKAGFIRGLASPCHFYHAARDIWMLVHGDDFVTVARAEGRAYVERTLRSQYEIKVDLAGPEADDPKEIKVLGRIITYEAHGLTYEADPGHMEGVIHQLGLTDALHARYQRGLRFECRRNPGAPKGLCTPMPEDRTSWCHYRRSLGFGRWFTSSPSCLRLPSAHR